jgi:methylated-DNA-[protein]-cysteine S-methyltransferase
MLYTTTESPIGELLLAGDEERLEVLWMGGAPEPDWVRADAPFAAARTQLGEYFAGERTAFDLVLAPAGTPFQQAVWEALRAIPYGRRRPTARSPRSSAARRRPRGRGRRTAATRSRSSCRATA